MLTQTTEEQHAKDQELLGNAKLRFLSQKLWKKITNWWTSESVDLVLRKAIVADTLLVTMYELHHGHNVAFTINDLLCFVPPGHRVHVEDQLCHDEISELFWIEPGELRIRRDFETLHAAMQYCGVFYPGFIEPVNPPVPRLDPDEPRSVLIELVEADMVVQPSRLKH